MDLYNQSQKPSAAYTKKHAIRLMNEYLDVRAKAHSTVEAALLPQWRPDVFWRDRMSDDETDQEPYINGQYRFVWPGNNRNTRRQAARRHGRRRSVRVPILAWKWWDNTSKYVRGRPI
jgi:hypothetical protein